MFGAHFRRLRPASQATHVKVVHNQLPLGERRYRQASVPDENLKLCPCCRHSEETMCHFLTCHLNPDLAPSLQTLSAETCNSDPHLVRFLILWGLKHWYSQTDEPFRPDVSSFPAHMHEEIAQALLESQERIGWYQASKGFSASTGPSWQLKIYTIQPRLMRTRVLPACIKSSMQSTTIPLGSGKLGTKCSMLQTTKTWRTSDRLSLRKYVPSTGIQNACASRIVTCVTAP